MPILEISYEKNVSNPTDEWLGYKKISRKTIFIEEMNHSR